MNPFTPAVRRAFAPPERLSPSAWAERYYFVPPDAAEPGPYRGSRVPYLAGIMDAIAEPGVEELVILKAAQVGYSSLLAILVGWIVDQDPASTLFVMPNESAADKLVDEVFRKALDSTPQLRAHLPGRRDDVTKDAIRFDTASVYTGYAGSPQTLAARALRFVFLDEIDKFPATSGKEGSPIALARKRGSTFGHRRRMVMGCTPTTPDNHIARAWDDCGDQRHYLVPCPACGLYQRLAFGQLRFDMPDVKAIEDRARQADYIQARGRAEYECERCKHRIGNERRGPLLAAGRWASAGQTVDADGVVRGDRPPSTRVGFRLSALHSPWVKFGDLAAQFVRAKGHRANMREFRNQWLGETFDELQQQVTVEQLRTTLDERPPPKAGIVPPWAGKVLVTVDVQGDRFYVVVRAWGRDRSQLLATNTVYTFDDVDRMYLNSFWPIEGADGEYLPVSRMFMDSGYRTNEVYAFAASHPNVNPVKGAPGYFPAQTLAWGTPAKELGVNLCTIDTQFFKDAVSAGRRDGTWLLNDEVTDEYLRHLAAEAKRPDPRSGRMVWTPVSEGAANHFLDCEAYQFAAAQFEQVHLLPDEATLVAQRQAERLERQRQATQATAVAAAGGYAQPAAAPDWLPRADNWFRRR